MPSLQNAWIASSSWLNDADDDARDDDNGRSDMMREEEEVMSIELSSWSLSFQTFHKMN